MALEPAYLTEALCPATSQDGVTLVRAPLVGKALGDAGFTREAGRPGRQGRRAVSPLDVRPGPRGRRGRPSPRGRRGACGRSERWRLPLPDAGPACCGLRVDGGPASGGPRRSVPSPGPCSRHPTRCRPAQGGCARLLPLGQCPPSCFPAPSTQGAAGLAWGAAPAHPSQGGGRRSRLRVELRPPQGWTWTRLSLGVSEL